MGVICVIAIAALAIGSRSGSKPTLEDSEYVTAQVTRGNLVIDDLLEATIEADESQVIKSKVEGRTTIISIVEEGTILAEEDVLNGRVLVELDSSDLRDEETEQAIRFQSEAAELTEASESFHIQEKENESNLKEAELAIKFGRMDLEKYLGEGMAKRFLKKEIELASLVESASLGGEASQKLRELEDDSLLEKMEKRLAKDKLSWTRILSASGYVSQSELESDKLAHQKSTVALMKATTAIELFEDYEIQKEAEQLRSDLEEAIRELERTKAQCRSEMAKADANLKSSSATFTRQRDKLKKIREQIEGCKIVATKPGLVTFPGSGRRNRDRVIEEGAEVYERQEIIRIPDLSSMVAQAKVHETVISRMKEGLPAEIVIEAIPDEQFKGTVKKVGLLPDSENRWMNPDLKVYKCDISIEGDVAGLKPGMSAHVRVFIDEHPDVLMIPVNAVAQHGKKSMCFISQVEGDPEPREVVAGDYNDNYVEIKEGLQEGERVVLNISSLITELGPPPEEESPTTSTTRKAAPKSKDASTSSISSGTQEPKV